MKVKSVIITDELLAFEKELIELKQKLKKKKEE
jgi:hypothetical protein